MNNNFLAVQNREELKDTMYFSGLDYEYSKTEGAKKSYIFKTRKFCLTISGRSISIDGVKMKSLRAAKQFIVESVI